MAIPSSGCARGYTTGLELLLNACESSLQILLTNDEKPLCFQEWFQLRQAAEILAPALQNIQQSLKFQWRDLRRIGCFSGPGSFTGIRLVLTTAAAMRRVTGAQLASLDYLQALATSVVKERRLLYNAKIFVLTHAKRDLVHFRKYMSFGPVIPAQPMGPIRLIKPAEALKIMASTQAYACGSALSRYPALFEPAATGAGPKDAPELTVLPDLVNPTMSALALLGRHGDYFHKDVEPVYIRECDAVDNLESIAEHEGRDAAELTQKLEEFLTRSPESDI